MATDAEQTRHRRQACTGAWVPANEANSVAKTSPTGGKIHATCAMPDDARCARRPHSNCCLARPGTATGRTRLLPLTAWPPPYQADDDRHSDSREIEKAYCLSPYEGPPQAEPRVGRVIASRGPASHNVSVPGTPCSRAHKAGVLWVKQGRNAHGHCTQTGQPESTSADRQADSAHRSSRTLRIQPHIERETAYQTC